jgi:hypothetical protein
MMIIDFCFSLQGKRLLLMVHMYVCWLVISVHVVVAAAPHLVLGPSDNTSNSSIEKYTLFEDLFSRHIFRFLPADSY